MPKERTVKERKKDLKAELIFTLIFATLFCMYILCTICAYMSENPRAGLTDSIKGAISQMTKNPAYLFPINYSVGTAVGITVLVDLLILVKYSYDILRVHNNLDTLKGSTVWASVSDFVRRFAEIPNEKKFDSFRTAFYNTIYSENVQVSLNQKKYQHNLNALIVGAPGTGKSRFFLKPNLLQMNAAYVVTDPSGGILQANGEALRRFGYNVKVFDLAQMGNCDTYNPLKYCYKESDIKKLVQAFIKNTLPDGGKGGGGSKDPFWDDSMNAFMCACVGLLVTKPEGYDIPYGQIPAITGGKIYEPVFSNLCEMTRMANKKWTPNSGIEIYGGASLGDGKNNTANASELAAIFENLRAWEAERQMEDPETMVVPYCLHEWENFRIAPEKTSTTILMTTAVRMDAFNIEQVRNLTSSDSLNLDTFGQQRDALFIITPTNDRTYNFLVCFLYTQLFDSMFTFGETLSAGSKDLKLANGELVRHFSKEQVKDGSFVDDTVAVLKNAHYEKVNGKGELEGYNKKTKKHITFFDGWYDILDANENLISRRPTEKLAKEYIDDLKSAKLVNGNGESMPQHVRCLMDEFPNIGEIPEFLDKLSTIRKYEISCVVICQTITQLKGMYEKNYETIDQDCDTTIFLGGDENSNNEYFAKKIGDATVRGSGNSVDNKKVSASYNIDSRQLMKPEELGRMPRSEELIFITGEQPARDTKYDYPSHKNYPFTHDYCMDFGIVEGSVFDRGIYGQTEPIQPIRKADVASAVPTIEAFTVDKFKSIFFTQNEAEAMSRMENAFMRFSLSDSEAATFG